mmetsp:Transcript_10842/g.26542  ORF Transcript_10842/g.26542 Transcript_10842/m.26542 type:complete len:203 (-) Transcript_10842:1207-1815(-)
MNCCCDLADLVRLVTASIDTDGHPPRLRKILFPLLAYSYPSTECLPPAQAFPLPSVIAASGRSAPPTSSPSPGTSEHNSPTPSTLACCRRGILKLVGKPFMSKSSSPTPSAYAMERRRTSRFMRVAMAISSFSWRLVMTLLPVAERPRNLGNPFFLLTCPRSNLSCDSFCSSVCFCFSSCLSTNFCLEPPLLVVTASMILRR